MGKKEKKDKKDKKEKKSKKDKKEKKEKVEETEKSGKYFNVRKIWLILINSLKLKFKKIMFSIEKPLLLPKQIQSSAEICMLLFYDIKGTYSGVPIRRACLPTIVFMIFHLACSF